ncbi:MATE family efflux transporter [Polymorphobacter arshaanensis]|nr:MATE family efflux transporter [Polymorphobacter arshaanensis]
MTTARMTGIIDGPIMPTLARLTVPVLVVIAAQTFVSILEAYWVSRLGTAAIAGVAVVLPLFILMGTMSNGGIGGGVSSAVSRALGAGRRDDANALLTHAVVIALAFGMLFAVTAFAAGPRLYAGIGAEGASLTYALTFSAWVFGGAPLIWVVNLMAAAMRGAGEVRLPAKVSLAGAVILVPLSPLLILGAGPVPGLGLAGAGIATLLYYGAAFGVYCRYLVGGRGVLVLRRTRLERHGFAAIMQVGGISAIGTLLTSLTAVGLTGVVGKAGPDALAGYGIASRIDSLLVPLMFGLGSGVVTMVAAASGAGHDERAGQVIRLAAGIAFAVTTLLGLTLAFAPDAWITLFTDEPAPLAWGRDYLQVNGPFYGFAGAGLIFYFAAQGRGQMRAAFLAALMRLLITAGGAYAIVTAGFDLAAAFWAVAAGSIVFAIVNGIGLARTFRQTGS